VQPASISRNLAGTAVATVSGMRPSVVLLACSLVAAASSGCFHGSQPPESQAAPYESFNEDNYSSVSSYGDGSESGEAYYGVGNASSPPERTPATPSKGGHQPY
jgi:hypothetical protein